MRRVITIVGALATLAAAAGCGTTSTGESNSAATSTHSSGHRTSGTSTSPSTPTSHAPSSYTSASTGVNAEVTPQRPIITPGGSPSPIALHRIFNHEGWEDGTYQIPGDGTERHGISATVTCAVGETLDFRFSSAKGSLHFTAGQSLNSLNPNLELRYAVLADGQQVAAETVTLTEEEELSADLTGVSVLLVTVKAIKSSNEKSTDAGCKGTKPATALITDLRVGPDRAAP